MLRPAADFERRELDTDDARRIVMEITLGPDLEAAVTTRAEREGVSPETLVLEVLRDRLLPGPHPEPRDEWERHLLCAATDCGVSLPHNALSSDGIYE